jgi:hypothetical protein
MAKPFIRDAEARDEQLVMQRGVSQLLFNYLPYRTVDWEDGLAIVQLGELRFASVWEEERKSTLLTEISEGFTSWVRRGGRIDPTFPDPKREPERFTIGMPDSIDAAVLDAALICQQCGQLIFGKKHSDGRLKCTNCLSARVHQFPFIFVHGCGAMVPIQEWLPATRKTEAGIIEASNRPIRCSTCGNGDNLYIPERSDRVKDMRVLCRKCKVEVLDRLLARCHRCLNRLAKDATLRSEGGAATIVQAIAMRLARYSASDAYYPYSTSVLRLDRPQLSNSEDENTTLLYRMLPPALRPDASFSPADSIKALSDRLSIAQKMGDDTEISLLLARIASVATSQPPQMPASTDVLLGTISPELEKGIRESLAFRTTVTHLAVEQKAQQEGGISDLVKREVGSLKVSLGIAEMLYVEDLPIISATVGYTRRDFNPTYEELGAQNLPVEIRAFPALQKTNAQRLGRPDIVGTIPIPAREGEHEGIFISLEPGRVLDWLRSNNIAIPDSGMPPIAAILRALEPIDNDRYYDTIWQLPVRRHVFGLIHSFSHAAMRAITRYAGIDRTSVAEYLFLPMFGFVVYDSSNSFKLGGVATLVRDHLASFLQSIADEAVECLYDPDCADHTGACHGCLHSPEISCRVFNHGLSRSFLIGGHTPWSDVSSNSNLIGFWETGAGR